MDISNQALSAHVPDYNEADIVCHCLSIKRHEIVPLLHDKQKNSDIKELITRSGAGSICTGCQPLLQEMLGKVLWIPVEITAIKTVSENTKSYRFKSKQDAFHPAQAGQHIIIQAYIKGVWELRRYTLTTAAEETDYREITVQRDPNGKVSNWLHQISINENLIRISQPMGKITPNLASVKALICLVGGIGITPTLSFIRTLDKKVGSVRQLIVDHSVSNEKRLVYQDELNALAKQHDNIHVNFRLTGTEGWINAEDIQALLKQYPESEFYICGSPNYSDAMLTHLKNMKVSTDSISIERFSTPDNTKTPSSNLYLTIGLVLLVAFLAQDMFQLKMAWLENLQTLESYKIYSGLFFVLYLLSQFIMPYNKFCAKPHTSAATHQQHKFRGMFAPLVFFIHSTHLSEAYLLGLSLVYFSNFLLGLFNYERIQNPITRIRYFTVWLPLHIVLSLLTLTLVGFHIYVETSY